MEIRLLASVVINLVMVLRNTAICSFNLNLQQETKLK